jgi:outer membrane protein OmpA-like peptidoglycan-associated protein
MSRAVRLGIFIVIGLIALGTGVFLIGAKHFLFRPKYQINAQFKSVAGLNNGAEVRVGGIHLGTVKRISLPDSPSGKLTVNMELLSSTQHVIRRDSVATIKTEGLLGDKYVEISFGSEKSAEIEPGDMIKGEIPEDFEEAAVAATNQAKAAAASFQDDADALKHNFFLRGFFERRGYEDTGDLKKNNISHLPSERINKEFVFDAKDLFDKPDNAKLKNQKSLDGAGNYLEQTKFSLAVIAVSADTGDAGTDRELTLARAKVVRDYLVQKFKFDDKHLKIIGLGKNPKAGEGSKVDIRIYL